MVTRTVWVKCAGHEGEHQELCGKPARWHSGDMPLCPEHYDLVHGIGDRCKS